MSDSAQLITSLKRALRSKGVTYAQIAKELDLSEASVKRLFADNNMSLQRLERICRMIAWDFNDLATQAQHNRKKLDQLSSEQEQEIASDILLLIIAVSVINGYSFEDIISQYNIDEHECIQGLAKLDRLKMLELLPGNKIKPLISQNFRWDPKGPIQAFFTDKVVHDFFNSRFAKDSEKLIVLNGLLDDDSNHAFQQKMDELAEQFNLLHKQSSPETIQNKHGHTLVLAFRKWRFSLFDEHVRNPNK